MPVRYVKLRPLFTPQSTFAQVEDEIKRGFLKELYTPLLRLLKLPRTTFQNSAASDSDQFKTALSHGTITFSRGTFSGKFSSGLTRHLRRLGATWDRREGTYKLSLRQMDAETRNDVLLSSGRFGQKLRAIDAQLEKVLPDELADHFFFSKMFDTALDRVHKEFRDNVGGLVIPPTYTEEERRKVAEEWEKNLRLHIRGFAQEEILKLRQQVKATVERGDRYGTLIRTIQESYGVTARKAQFLARQETKLMTTKYQEAQYQTAGVNEYTWHNVTGTPLHPVRTRHKALGQASAKGVIFRFDQPPVTTEPGQAERRNNPGQDYNCRCWAVPVVRFVGAKK